MKIRYKMLFTEGGISLVLLICLILSIFSLSEFFTVTQVYKSSLDEGYRYKILRINIEELLYQPQIQKDNFNIASSLWDDLDLSFQSMLNSISRRSISAELRDSFIDLDRQWFSLTSSISLREMEPFFLDYFENRDSGELSLFNYIQNMGDPQGFANLEQILGIVSELKLMEQSQVKTLELYQREMPLIRKHRINVVISWNIAALIILGLLSILQGRKLLDNLNRIKVSLDKVSGGEFSHKLRIPSNDEFGTLARDFNTVTEALWAKMEAVQNILSDVGDSISNEIEIEKVEKAIVYLAMKNSAADGAALYHFNEDKSALVLEYGVGNYRPPFFMGEDEERVTPFGTTDALLASFAGREISLGETIIGEAAVNGEALFIKRTHATSFARPKNHPYHISSSIVIPIRVGNVVLGVVSLVHSGDKYFSDLEFANTQSFCELAAISIDNLMKYNEMLEVFELNREIDIAGEIQHNLLPQQIPQLRHTDMTFETRTRRGINGDFYDCYMIDRETVLITICEVAGKGVPAALVITMIKTIIKLVAATGKNSAEIVRELNLNITEKIRIENIASVSLILYNQNTGEVSYASGGHQPLIAYEAARKDYTEHRPKGIPVGLDKTAEYVEDKFILNDDDFLVLFTDGVPEARDRSGKEYSVDTIKELCRKNRNNSSREIVDEILSDLNYFHRNSQQWDDQTIFVLKRGETNQ